MRGNRRRTRPHLHLLARDGFRQGLRRPPEKLLDRFGSRLNYVLVLNQLRGENFELLEKSGLKQQALELNAKIISLRRLHEPVIAKIDAGSTSFWAAKNKSETDVKGLGLLERQRVKVWLRHAYEQIATTGA